MSHERKFTQEEIDAHIIKRIEDYVSDYANLMKYWEIFENKPMTEKERRQYDNTISAFRDKNSLSSTSFSSSILHLTSSIIQSSIFSINFLLRSIHSLRMTSSIFLLNGRMLTCAKSSMSDRR